LLDLLGVCENNGEDVYCRHTHLSGLICCWCINLYAYLYLPRRRIMN